jgi:DNA repair photolyase
LAATESNKEIGARPGTTVIRGRGTAVRPEGRFEAIHREAVDDGWNLPPDPEPAPQTELFIDHARSIISRNHSPDLPFDQSINPYRGCEHGCVYCFARPAHAYLNLSPGLDFETKLFYKPDAAALLDAELRKPGYQPSMISLGANTDPYQPIERKLGITRSILEVLLRFGHPVGIVTKGAAMIERDLDLLAELARNGLVHVAISVTTLDPELKRRLEPRTAAPATRLRVIERLRAAGVPTMVFFSPVIPFINDAEMESVLTAARDAGAEHASYTPLRLPYEVKLLFRDWLETHYPQKAAHVMSLVQQMRGGRDNDSRFGTRMRGQGEYAAILEQRFRVACRRLGLNLSRGPGLRLDRFAPPPAPGDQLGLGF